MEISLKVIGGTITSMVVELNFLKILVYILVIMLMENLKVKGLLNLKMKKHILDNGLMGRKYLIN